MWDRSVQGRKIECLNGSCSMDSQVFLTIFAHGRDTSKPKNDMMEAPPPLVPVVTVELHSLGLCS